MRWRAYCADVCSHAVHGPLSAGWAFGFKMDFTPHKNTLYLCIFVYNLSFVGIKVLELEKASLSRAHTRLKKQFSYPLGVLQTSSAAQMLVFFIKLALDLPPGLAKAWVQNIFLH